MAAYRKKATKAAYNANVIKRKLYYYISQVYTVNKMHYKYGKATYTSHQTHAKRIRNKT